MYLFIYLFLLPTISMFWLIYKPSRTFKGEGPCEQTKWLGARLPLANSKGKVILSQAAEWPHIYT